MRLQRIIFFLGCFFVVLGLAGCRSNLAKRSSVSGDNFSFAMPDNFEQSVQAENKIPELDIKNNRRTGGFLHRFSLPMVESNRRLPKNTLPNAHTARQKKNDSLVQMTPSTINRWKVFGKMEQNFRSLFFMGDDKEEKKLSRSKHVDSGWDNPDTIRPDRLSLTKSEEAPVLVPPPAPSASGAE